MKWNGDEIEMAWSCIFSHSWIQVLFLFCTVVPVSFGQGMCGVCPSDSYKIYRTATGWQLTLSVLGKYHRSLSLYEQYCKYCSSFFHKPVFESILQPFSGSKGYQTCTIWLFMIPGSLLVSSKLCHQSQCCSACCVWPNMRAEFLLRSSLMCCIWRLTFGAMTLWLAKAISALPSQAALGTQL